jgi:hypothetical protein
MGRLIVEPNSDRSTEADRPSGTLGEGAQSSDHRLHAAARPLERRIAAAMSPGDQLDISDAEFFDLNVSSPFS